MDDVGPHPLRVWRLAEGLTLDAAAASVGCSHRAVWYDWEIGRRLPDRTYMLAIYRLTRGAVTPNDFYDLPDLEPALPPPPPPVQAPLGEPLLDLQDAA